MKRLLTMVLALALLLPCIPAVGQEASVWGDGSPVTLTVWSRDVADSVTGRAFESDVAAFQAKYTNVKVEFLHIQHADVVAKWNSAFAAGVGPDVLDVGVSHIAGRVQLGHLQPLDEYLKDWEEKDNVIPGMIDYGSYKDQIYAIAYNASPAVFAWRKDYFEEVGLNPDEPPANWEQFKEYCQKLVLKDGDLVTRGAVELPDTRGAHFLWQFFLQNAAETIDYENDEPNFTQPAAIEAAQFLADIADYAYLSNAGTTGAFISGNAAMSLTISPDTLLSMIAEDPSLENKIGFAPSLTQKKGGIHSGAWLYAINPQSKQPDLAWEWINFIFTEERCRVRMDEFGIVPPVYSLYEAFTAANPELRDAQLQNLNQAQAYPKLTWSNIYEENLHLAYDKLVYHTATSQEAMTDLQNEVMALIGK